MMNNHYRWVEVARSESRTVAVGKMMEAQRPKMLRYAETLRKRIHRALNGIKEKDALLDETLGQIHDLWCDYHRNVNLYPSIAMEIKRTIMALEDGNVKRYQDDIAFLRGKIVEWNIEIDMLAMIWSF